MAIEKAIPNTSLGDYKPHLKSEALRVWELYKLGIFREIYFDKNKHKAVIIMECKDIEEAEDNLKTLPLVKEGFITFEVIALEPYSGFSRLFARA